ncbi:hypothetical protein M2103_000882 [Ereboglobus sp. PH5-5]|uniref:sugar-binding domain-containing protein n=1 Tax=Ereboglobus sp. PH5-5 TaxID=2940529 RepID=UPI0024067913|nr:sugar-binding domain-containing protein [Ereboglobus sp. PH5-5]MDF9832668.1 hypothetical protein [Ereboglobus sp. PH5-5]
MSKKTVIIFALILIQTLAGAKDELSLAGKWQVSLRPPPSADAAWREIRLPGTLDDAGIGEALALKPELTLQVLTRLQRKHIHIGPAWYRREVVIPENWRGKQVVLELERVLWESRVFVDGVEISREDSLSTPHRHDLTAALKPGRHELILQIDNSEILPDLSRHHTRKYQARHDTALAHAYTNHTQVMWNGALGFMRLAAIEPDAIRTISAHPRVTPGFSVQIALAFDSAAAKSKTRNAATFDLVLRNAAGKQVAAATKSFLPNQAGDSLEAAWTLPEGSVRAWDELAPHLYKLEVRAPGKSGALASTTLGFREIAAQGSELHVNGKRVFLRGTLECAVFPLTGYPATSVAEWKRIIATAKEWGLNHFRFHSWCPPDAAFQAADELGFYLQAELPHWSLLVGQNKKSWNYLNEEARRILTAYGNHPSFVLMSLGNELQGDLDLLNKLVGELRAEDSRRLYTTTSFTFKKGHGRSPEPQDEFFITQYTNDGWVRGQGVFNEKPPSFDNDYSHAAKNIKVPIITHEIGQYSVYPDLAEIKKYKGNLVPLNFIAVQNDLKAKGLLKLADKFTEATGRFATLLYKEEIERALRTPEFDGFQLLGLQDFPGQGTALVGMVNVFWEGKRFIKSSEFREFCSATVPLARLPKAVYERGETVNAAIQVANYGNDIDPAVIKWRVKDQAGKQIASGQFDKQEIASGGTVDCGRISVAIPGSGPAARWTLEVTIDGTPYRNHWNLWVYPKETTPVPDNVTYTRTLGEALTALSAGKKVLFNPPVAQTKGIDGKFVPVFWSPVHFPEQPGTMGMLCDPKHPALKNFPTGEHSDWQWWDLALKSKSVRIDGLSVTPIVRVIDNFARNHSLAAVFEARIGNGRLLFCTIDLDADLQTRPPARQLRNSILGYMAGDSFNPNPEMKPDELGGMILSN